VAKAAGDKTALERIGRELRYWIARRGTAQVVAAPPDARRVHFGSTVTVEGGDGGRQTWRIVGEDEADPDQGTLSYVSLLAQALVSRRAGETVPLGDTRIEILSID
jgi:transcription elongation GreA/GreB family factor